MPRETIRKTLAPRVIVAAVVIALCGACLWTLLHRGSSLRRPIVSSAHRSSRPAPPRQANSAGQVIGTRPVNELPLNGRNPMNMVALAPSVLPEEERVRRGQRAPAGVHSLAAEADLSAVDQALAQLPIGNIAYNAPPAMFKGESHPVSVILSPTATAAQLGQQLHTLLGNKENVETAQIQISQTMQASLTGEGFAISPQGPQVQAVSALQPTEWDWTVSPAQDGDLRLQLVLEAILVLDGGKSEPRRVRTFTKTIQVRVQTADVVKGFIGNNWQWLWSTLLVPLAAYMWHRRRRARRQ